METKCKNNWKYIKSIKFSTSDHSSNFFIWRGDKSLKHDYYLFEGKSKRESANTSNYYTILFSELLPSWKNIPRRDHALVCSTNFYKARRYAEEYPYIIIPYDTTLIAETHQDDFWDILGPLEKEKLDLEIVSLNTLNRMFSSLDFEDTKVDIKRMLKMNTFDFLVLASEIGFVEDFFWPLILNYFKIKPSLKSMEEIDPKDKKKLTKIKMITILNYYFSPQKLNITVSPYTQISNEGQEVWLDKSALIISIDKFKNLKQKNIL